MDEQDETQDTSEPLASGTIVVVETNDQLYGRLRAPGIIRYYDEDHDAYEINLLAPTKNGAPAGRAHWWTVTRDEITETVGMSRAQRYLDYRS